MGNDKVIYIMACVALVFTFDFLLTKDNQKIVRRAFVINIMMSCFLMLLGEVTLFLSLIILNFFIFLMSSIAALEESEKESFQEPGVDIPVLIVVLIIVGIVVISTFQSIDFLNAWNVDSIQFKQIGMVDFGKYVDLISVIFVVFISTILFFNTGTMKK